MPIDVKCHECSKQFRLKDELNGKKCKCNGCGAIVTAIPLKAKRPSSGGRPEKRATQSPEGRPAAKPTSRPSTSSRSARGGASGSRPARTASGSAAPKRTPAKRSKPRVNPYADDYRDASPDDLFGQPGDDFGDDYGDDYGDPYADDAFGAPATRSKKSSKKKSSSSGGGSRFGFNPTGLNVALVVGGIALFVLGINETRLAAKSKATPDNISLSQLVANGNGGNIHLTISGVEPQTGEFVYESRSQAATTYTKVFVPCVPLNSADRKVKLILFSTTANNDNEVNQLMSQTSHTGMIVNDIRGLASDEKRLLSTNLGGTNPNDVLIFEVGRKPSSATTRILFFLGGVALSLGGLAWIFMSGQPAAAPAKVRSAPASAKGRSGGGGAKGNPYAAGRGGRTSQLTLGQKLFSFQGRIERGTFWGLSIVASFIGYGVFFVCLVLMHNWGRGSSVGAIIVGGAMVITLGVMLWTGFALQVKRWQDRDKSGLMCLVGLIPIIGPLWVFVECGCLPGTPGNNSYGPPPA